ncbi:MAG: hypothetical protein ACXW05_02425 [Gemmatirosa sp.]
MEILVATSEDFALLRNGRPVASGAWEDVQQVRAYTADDDARVVCVALRLRSGRELVARDDAPGWDDLVDAAESALPGMRRRRDWWPDVQAGAIVLFER